MQITAATRDAMLANLIETGNVLDPVTCFVGVGTALNNQGIATVLADITQATGALATRQEVTEWSDVFLLDNGCAVVNGPLMTFAPASSAQAQTIACWYIASLATLGTLKAFGIIAPPVPLPDEMASWSIVLRVTLDPNGTWSAEVVFNG